MFLLKSLFFSQVFLCFFPKASSNSTSIFLTVSFSATNSSTSFNGTASTQVGNTVVTTPVTETTTSTQLAPATPSSAVTVSSSATTTSLPPGGSQEAVVLFVEKMTIAEFEGKRSEFLVTLRTVVEEFCSKESSQCGGSSRKRRASSTYQVYIAAGYPKQSESNLQVATFVLTPENVLLSRNVLFNIVEDHKANLSTSLGRNITGVARLNFFTNPTPTSGVSDKTKFLAIFFGVFLGIILILTVCIGIACWIGRKGETSDNVRPLTTSNLELVENQR